MPSIFQPGLVHQLGVAYSTIYTTPASTKSVVTFLRITNVTAGIVTVRLHVVPLAGAEGVTNAILYDYPIPANDFIDMGKGLLLAAGDFVRANASGAASLNVKLDVIENPV